MLLDRAVGEVLSVRPGGYYPEDGLKGIEKARSPEAHPDVGEESEELSRRPDGGLFRIYEIAYAYYA